MFAAFKKPRMTGFSSMSGNNTPTLLRTGPLKSATLSTFEKSQSNRNLQKTSSTPKKTKKRKTQSSKKKKLASLSAKKRKKQLADSF